LKRRDLVVAAASPIFAALQKDLTLGVTLDLSRAPAKAPVAANLTGLSRAELATALVDAGVVPAAKAMSHEVSWPLFGVLALWILGGLLLYCLASELVGAMGPARVKALLFSPHSSSAER